MDYSTSYEAIFAAGDARVEKNPRDAVLNYFFNDDTLPYPDRLSLLRQREDRWRRARWQDEVVITVPMGDSASSYLDGGAFVLFHTPSRLSVLNLPSLYDSSYVPGSELQQWRLHELELEDDVVQYYKFELAADEDLIAIVTQCVQRLACVYEEIF